MTRALWFILGLLACSMALAPAPAAVAMPALPAPRVRVSPLRADPAVQAVRPEPPAPSVRPQPALNPSTAIGPLGWAGQVQCWNCAPFIATARVTHYDPMLGDINCWDWGEKESYCYSPTFIGVHWKSVYGIAAACPPEWKIGTWVVLPNEQGAYICLDRGDQVKCDENGICAVDILGPGGAAWDGQTMPVTLWVPLDPPREDE